MDESFTKFIMRMKTKYNPKSHTHLQFAQASATTKIAKEYVFANATNRKENKVRKHNNMYSA